MPINTSQAGPGNGVHLHHDIFEGVEEIFRVRLGDNERRQQFHDVHHVVTGRHWVMMRCLSSNGITAACGNRLLSSVWHVVHAIFNVSDLGRTEFNAGHQAAPADFL